MQVRVTQDLRRFKTKDIGGFSFKQLGWIALATGTFFAIYKITGIFGLSFILACILLIIGIFEPFPGMNNIDYVKLVLSDIFSPREYYYSSDVVYDKDELKELFGDDIAIPSCWDEVIQTSPKANKIDKKYRKSSDIDWIT